MFSKPSNNPAPKPPTSATPATPPLVPTGPTQAATTASPAMASDLGAKKGPRVASLIANDITLEGNLSGDGELQIDGVIRGDVRVARMTVGETGHVEGGIYAETAEIRGRVIGSITAKQVRLYGACYVDGDITHEQLAIESGAFFQGRSLKFQRQAPTLSQAPVQAAPTQAPPVPERPAVSPATGNATIGSPSTNGDASKSPTAN